jgi:AraC family transcriptional regulator, transcriptional activator of pobA
MNIENIRISRILNKVKSNDTENYYTICWIHNGVKAIEIDGKRYKEVTNAVFFFNPEAHWKIIKNESSGASGYLLYIPREILNLPHFKNLHINEVRLFNSDEIPKINLTPGIEIRIQSILEMLDELLSTRLKHREEAILALLNTFFVYCDGKCNIKSVITDTNAKSALVYRFKKSLNQNITQYHEVGHYASLLNVSDKYLNECVKEILGVNAKCLIDEQLVMRARHLLKFSDKNVKEISYDLGFNSPEYFSYFLKKHTHCTPLQLRKS